MAPSPLSEEFLKSSSGRASGIVLMNSAARDRYAIKPKPPWPGATASFFERATTSAGPLAPADRSLRLRRAIAVFKRSLIFVHRWMGVALAILFMLWFSSGIVMMYWSYPQVNDLDRLARAAVLRPADIRVTPAEAYAGL